MKIFIFFLCFCFSISAEDFLECNTEKHIGLNFFGKDYEKILDYLKLKKFEIKISRNREEIYKQEKLRSNSSKNYFPNTSHFIEIVLIKSSGYAIPMHCSWIFDIRVSNIKEKDFNCVGHPNNDRVFSLNYNGNFMYSSKFDEYFKKRKDTKTLHSLIGKCKKN
ncbi:MAG: hypothetical protein CBC25_01900 [Pelagibacteraceae bacterium TMED65]|nr:hypothetical protein [Rickettsiales bacterium]OUU52869.1 MAG: hypothetical protein CBC25_01900 [Pelagibacteraceae bacterium TMED65]|tara:strand:- start:3792 stop:4283 length:492 start_codon:yes stop_codon:yes gene_type:complete